MKPLLTTSEVAKWLDKPQRWVREQAAAGNLPATRIGQHWRFREQDIEIWLERHSNTDRDPLRMTDLAAARRKSA